MSTISDIDIPVNGFGLSYANYAWSMAVFTVQPAPSKHSKAKVGSDPTFAIPYSKTSNSAARLLSLDFIQFSTARWHPFSPPKKFKKNSLLSIFGNLSFPI